MTFTKRTECIFCKNKNLRELLLQHKSFPVGNFAVESVGHYFHFIPYNVQYCISCGVVQTKYVGDLNLIYENNFAGAYGTIRSSMNTLFAEFIHFNDDIHSIAEIGAGNGDLSVAILDTKKLPYTIVDPSYAGPKSDRIIIPTFFENHSESLTVDTIVMSHVFEHFYEPLNVLQKLREQPNLKYIYLSFPDLESFIKNNIDHVLNPEHTYYVENDFLRDVFSYFGFKMKRQYFHENHSVFFEFVKEDSCSDLFPKQDKSYNDVIAFFQKVHNNIENATKVLNKNPSLPVYIWPCSMHTLFSFSLGLPTNKVHYVLDNSPLKIGKYLYGYKHKCLSFKDVIQTTNTKIVILTGGCYNKEILKTINDTIILLIV